MNEHWQLQAVIGGGRISLSATGNTLVVGRISEGHTTTDINGVEILGGSQPYHGGAVYVFIRRAGAWSQQAHLLASDLGQKYYYGASVSLSADGDLLAIGAPGADSNAGAVYLFSHSNGDWTEINRLQASNPGRNDANDANSVFGDSFGQFLNLSGDGKTLAVSAPGEASLATGINGDQTDNSNPNKGAVYVFAHSNETWQQEAYVKPSNTSTFFGFGGGIDSVSLSENGNTLAVGAVGENSAATGINGDQNLRGSGAGTGSGSGATYVFVRISGAWEQQAYIKASNAGYLDHFGQSVSLSADGNTLAVGANREQSATTGLNTGQNDNSAEGAGAVYVFVRNFGSWQQRAYIKASNTDSNDSFGSYITLSADGYTLAVGATGEYSAATEINGDQDDNSTISRGAIYLY